MTKNLTLIILFCLFIISTRSQLTIDDIISEIFIKQTPYIETTTSKFVEKLTKTTISDPQGNEEIGAYKSCGINKECVPRHLCVNGVINRNGENVINIRINDNGCSYSEICCDVSNKRTDAVIPAIPKEQHIGCGWRNQDGVGFKITGDYGNETQFGEFPWMVALLNTENVSDTTVYVYQCGGSIIAPNVVLTSGNCAKKQLNKKSIFVRAGEWDTQNDNEILNHVDIAVKEIITHENFNSPTAYNDVALLILEQPFVWQENIRPICLPPTNANFDGQRCIVTSWGKDKFGSEGKYQEILKKIELPVVPRDTCQKNLRQTRLGLYYNLHESFLCAGGEKGIDICTGGGGSPLVCPMPGVKNRYYQAGVVSWGIGCGEENIPGVYASVSYMRTWILEKLASRNIPTVHFTP